MALDLAQFRATQEVVRDEMKEIKEKEEEEYFFMFYIYFWGAQREKGWCYCPKSCSPPSRNSEHREVSTVFKLSTKH
jgi:hypothetical protein